jgi:hypothetical protein
MWCRDYLDDAFSKLTMLGAVVSRKTGTRIGEMKVAELAQLLMEEGGSFGKCSVMLDLIQSGIVDDRIVFPLKDHPAAATKTNVRVSDVLTDIKRYYPGCWSSLPLVMEGLVGCGNDEAAGWLIWYVAAFEVNQEIALTVMSLRHISGCIKEISTAVKSVGLNSTREGAMVCELNVLVGRGAVPGNADEDVMPRISKKRFLSEKAAVMDPVLLREAIRDVLAEELVVEPKWDDKDSYWSRRWMYTKSGSHTRKIEDVVFGQRLDLPPQPTRREFSEAIEENLVAFGKPEVWSGLSWKLEHGKTRAIYGCDSRSYFTFDYLLQPVEAVWRNRRALLNPGSELQGKLYPRLGQEGPYRFMLDFDDYNSQHTLDAMRMVIEEACAGAPHDVLSWAVESWDSMYVRWVSSRTGKLETKRMVGTLPSGHRATTFVNTILNAAYCRMVAGPDYNSVRSLHAGDDVIMSGGSEAISRIVANVERSPLRVNRSKQSVGNVGGEFLRVAYREKEAFGYMARAAASCVSGNWVTEAEVSPRSYVENFTRLSWTMANRSGVKNIGAVLTSSLRRRVPALANMAHEIVTLRTSVGGSPVRTDSPNKWKKVDLEGGQMEKPKMDVGLASYATDAYLHSHVDIKLLKEAGVEPGSLRAMMLKASYKPRGTMSPSRLSATVTICPQAVKTGLVVATHFPHRGEKTLPTALRMLEGMFKAVDWRKLVARLRGTDESLLSTTGKMEWPVGCDLGVSYSDCMTLRESFTRPTLVMPIYRVYV